MNTLNESCSVKTTVLHVPSLLAKRLYYYVQWTGHFVCNRDFYIKRSSFSSYLLLYTISGSGILNYENNSCILYENSIALIDCNRPHEYYPSGDGWEFRYIHFNGALSDAYYEYISRLKNGVPIMLAEPEAQNSFLSILELSRLSVSEEICSKLIYDLLADFISSERTKTDSEDYPLWLTNTLDRISNSYKENITAASLAGEAHLSRSFFSTEFKKYTGHSPYSYILFYKLTAAKKLLYTSDKTVDEVSSLCGFSSSSAFIRAFKRTEGVSPAVYRAGERSKS